MFNSEQQEPSALKVYLRLMGYVKPYIFIFLLSVCGYIFYAWANVLFSKIMENLVNAIDSGDPDQRYWIPLQVMGATLLRGVSGFVGAYFIARVAFSVVHNLRLIAFNHMVHLPNPIFDRESSGHLISIITYNINGVTAAATDALKIMLREGLTVIAAFGYLIYLDWKLTLVFVAVSPLIGILVVSVGKRLRRLSTKVQATVGDITQVTSEMINGFRVMRSFGGEDYEKRRFFDASKKNYLQNMKIIVTSAANAPVMAVIIALAMAILIFAALSFTGLRSPGEFMGYMTAVGVIINPMRRLGEVTPLILKGVAAAQSVFNLLDEPAEVDKGEHEVQRVAGNVRIENVTFAYPGQGKNALNNVTLEAKAGEVVALVGRSGSGKSSLVSLLTRFYDTKSGQIFIDDVPIQDYKLANLRRQIALVNQQVTLFNDSIAANIAYGSLTELDQAAIRQAADAAYASEFILQQPDGFETMIGEQGARLSGGQRQRIAIARAILKDAPILILDEATSALDNESEHFIQAALERVMQNRTTFVVAHRLSTIERADKIIVMADGAIVEQGTHEELLALNGHYTRLHAKQFDEDADISELDSGSF